MKRTFILIATLVVAACGGSDGGGGGSPTPSTPVETPISHSCLDGTAYCDNIGYSQYYGWMPYPGMYPYAYNYTNYFNQNGFCDCPAGYMPVYNGMYGLGCVSQSLLNPYSGYYQIVVWGAAGGGWGYNVSGGVPAPQTPNNFPQYSNIPGSNNYGSCGQTVTQSCILSEPNTCGKGALCKPVMGNSNLGVCVQN